MTKIILVGCGKMGSAMLAGWLEQGLAPQDILVVEPNPVSLPDDVGLVGDAGSLPDDFNPDLVILAVKPQVMDQVVPHYARYPQATFLSIAAGKTIGFFQGLLGDVSIIRAMPNTPAAVGAGITVCVPNAKVEAGARALAHRLLQAVGDVAWLEDEALMDAVTAVSGSGPAYVFLLAEVMAQAGIQAGLPPELADQLARATVTGAGLLLKGSEQSSAQLRINVTSPGGTTAAALSVLMDPAKGFAPLMTQAVAAATRRGKELAG